MRGVFDNLALKAASLGLATLLWFVIAGEKTSEMGVLASVELQNFPKDLELTGDTVTAVEVRVRAAPGLIHGLGPGEISAEVDLAGAAEGERIVHLTEDSIRKPFGVKVVKITPSLLTLTFERTLQKVVPVRPRLLGRPAQGYEVAEVSSDPVEVRIAGPKSRVQEVESAYTEPVSVEGARITVVDEVSVGLEDPLLRLQGSPRVRVTARVRQEHERRELDGVEVEVRNGAGTVKPTGVRVVLSGPATALAAVRPSDVHAWVDAASLTGPGSAPVAVELSGRHGGVSVLEVDPAQVAFRPRQARRAR